MANSIYETKISQPCFLRFLTENLNNLDYIHRLICNDDGTYRLPPSAINNFHYDAMGMGKRGRPSKTPKKANIVVFFTNLIDYIKTNGFPVDVVSELERDIKSISNKSLGEQYHGYKTLYDAMISCYDMANASRLDRSTIKKLKTEPFDKLYEVPNNISMTLGGDKDAPSGRSMDKDGKLRNTRTVEIKTRSGIIKKKGKPGGKVSTELPKDFQDKYLNLIKQKEVDNPLKQRTSEEIAKQKDAIEQSLNDERAETLERRQNKIADFIQSTPLSKEDVEKIQHVADEIKQAYDDTETYLETPSKGISKELEVTKPHIAKMAFDYIVKPEDVENVIHHGKMLPSVEKKVLNSILTPEDLQKLKDVNDEVQLVPIYKKIGLAFGIITPEDVASYRGGNWFDENNDLIRNVLERNNIRKTSQNITVTKFLQFPSDSRVKHREGGTRPSIWGHERVKLSDIKKTILDTRPSNTRYVNDPTKCFYCGRDLVNPYYKSMENNDNIRPEDMDADKVMHIDLHHVSRMWKKPEYRYRDNYLDNLMFLCPNCHSATASHSKGFIASGEQKDIDDIADGNIQFKPVDDIFDNYCEKWYSKFKSEGRELPLDDIKMNDRVLAFFYNSNDYADYVKERLAHNPPLPCFFNPPHIYSELKTKKGENPNIKKLREQYENIVASGKQNPKKSKRTKR